MADRHFECREISWHVACFIVIERYEQLLCVHTGAHALGVHMKVH
jgi:hypothetical protein